MVKTHSQRAAEARVLNDLRLAFKIDEIREAIFGQQGYDAALLKTRANYEGKTDVERGEEINRVYWPESIRTYWRSVEDRKKFILMMAREEIINEDRDIASGLLKACGTVGHIGCFKCSDKETAQFKNRGLLTGKLQTASGSGKGGKDKRKTVTRSLNCKLREEVEIEEVLKKLQKLSKLVWTNAVTLTWVLKISMVSTSKADKVSLVGYLSPVIGVGDEEDTIAKLVEWPHLKGSRVEYPIGSSRFREFCNAKSSIDGIWGHAFGYRGNFFRNCNVSQGGDYLYLLPNLAKEKKCRRLGDEFDYGLTLPLSNLAKSVMNMIAACPAQLNCNFSEVILVCETLNERWAASSSERRITAKDFLEYYVVKYVTATNGAYLSSSSSRPCIFDLSLAGPVWNDNLLWVSSECLQQSDEEPLELNNITITKVSRKESFIDAVAREGTELEAVLKELEISRFKRVASKDDKVKRSQAKRKIAGKTPGSMEEKLSTPEFNTPLKLAWLNEMPDGPMDMATVSSTVVQNLAKRKARKRGAASCSVTSDSVDDSSKRRKVTSPTKSQVVLEESDKITEGVDLRLRFEVEAGLLEETCLSKAREKMVAIVDDEFMKFARALRGVHLGFWDRSIELEKKISQLKREKNQFEENLTREREAFQLELEKEREAAALKLKEVRTESVVEAKRLVTASAISQNNLAGKLYQLRYTKVEIMAFSEGNYEEEEIMDEEEAEEMEDGLNVAEKTAANNQETID
ncbi:hypothetical protein GIB67_021156 [Kingdonia uniflora]|uniref:Uncharacterized protein n=1 Tax=Kingdonia uniflora TaxID=39325 RepID=A0A7J7N797_9MAGN|nr:hypothetical protein GIB67_021156 [Kingdonia uniflora]